MDGITEIKERVSIKEIIRRYTGIEFKKNMACCPFHSEKTPSFAIKGKRYTCFSCGERGDAIDFVARYFGLSTSDAAKKIDDDFGLNIYHELTNEERALIARREEQREQQRIIQHEIGQRCGRLYRGKCNRYLTDLRIMDKFNPSKYGLNDVYIKAYNEVQALEHWFAEVDLYK